jgi:hypothetical protein
MRSLVIALITLLLAACAGSGFVIPGPEERAARNRCEAMRSYRPYYPNECGELSGAMPYSYYQ